MRSSIVRLCGLSLLLLGGCISIDRGDLVHELDGRELELTMGAAPAGAEPVRAITIYQSGWYLFGFAPFQRVSLDQCLDALVEEAKKADADGVCQLKIDHRPAAAFRFYVFPIPDWGASVSMTGMAYRRKR